MEGQTIQKQKEIGQKDYRTLQRIKYIYINTSPDLYFEFHLSRIDEFCESIIWLEKSYQNYFFYIWYLQKRIGNQ
jgi:hypothetical protein